MKVKDGKVVLSPKDRRFGNFVYTELAEHWKISDIADRFSVRLHKTTIVGRLITLGISEGSSGNYLSNLATVLYDICLTAHDSESMAEIIKACHSVTERHPDLYGGKAEPSEKKDADALEEVRAVQEVIDKTSDDADKAD